MEKKIKLNKNFLKAMPVLEKIKANGYQAYFVGGSVRDALLQFEVNDVDIASSAMPYEIKQIFEKTVDIGIEHGTVMVLYDNESYEITTFRTESGYKDFRRPESVSFVRSLREDLKRRDFTMNALAVDEKGQIIDYFNGQEDLDNKIIRAVGNPVERFHEDALRMMRAVRFSGQLDFEIEKDTLKAIRHNAALLEKIAIERIYVEFVKLMLGKTRKKGMKAMVQTKLYMYCPELGRHKQALIHLANGSKQIENERQAWALLLYHILFIHPFPEEFSISQFLKSWRCSNKIIRDVESLLEGVHHRKEHDRLSPWLVFNLGEELSFEVEELMEHIKGKSNIDGTKEVLQNLPIESKKELAISGHDILKEINKKPGKWLGEAIDKVLYEVVEGNLSNNRDLLLDFIKESVSEE